MPLQAVYVVLCNACFTMMSGSNWKIKVVKPYFDLLLLYFWLDHRSHDWFQFIIYASKLYENFGCLNILTIKDNPTDISREILQMQRKCSTTAKKRFNENNSSKLLPIRNNTSITSLMNPCHIAFKILNSGTSKFYSSANTQTLKLSLIDSFLS